MKISDDMYKVKQLDILSTIAKELKRFNDREEAKVTKVTLDESFLRKSDEVYTKALDNMKRTYNKEESNESTNSI